MLEPDTPPVGLAGLSSDFIPAHTTRWHAERSIEDDVELMAGEIQMLIRKLADSVIVDLCCRRSAPALAWLAATHGIPFVLLEDRRQADPPLTETLAETLRYAETQERGTFGWYFEGKPSLAPPNYAEKAGASLFHTQGGFVIHSLVLVWPQDSGV